MSESRPHLFWEGPQAAYASFAVVNQELCHWLWRSQAVDLTIVSNQRHWDPMPAGSRLETLQPLDVRYKGLSLRDRGSRPYLWVRHQWPPRAQSPGRIPCVVFQPWEYSLLPVDFVEILNGAVEVWTTSTFCRNAFLESGVRTPVHVVPNGANPQIFTPRGVAAELSTCKGLRLLNVGATIDRKGIDVLLEAYGRAFRASDDVCLVLKDIGAGSPYEGQTRAQVIAERIAEPGFPEVQYIDRRLEEHELAALYRAADVFVSPYRGEGFSLPTLEAMASGLPVVTTRGGATDDFVDEVVGWRIESSRRSLGGTIYGKALPGEGFLLEPSVEHLTSLLRPLAVSPDEIVRKGIAAAQRVRRAWTWKHAALKVLARVEALTGSAVVAPARDTLGPEECVDGLADAVREKKGSRVQGIEGSNASP